MRPASIADKEAPESSGYERAPLAAGPDVEAVGATEVAPCAACFLSPKHTRVSSLLSSRSVSRALSAFCHSVTARRLASP